MVNCLRHACKSLCALKLVCVLSEYLKIQQFLIYFEASDGNRVIHLIHWSKNELIMKRDQNIKSAKGTLAFSSSREGHRRWIIMRNVKSKDHLNDFLIFFKSNCESKNWLPEMYYTLENSH